MLTVLSVILEVVAFGAPQSMFTYMLPTKLHYSKA